MVDIPTLGGSEDGEFDAIDEFVPATLPEPGPFLEGHDILTGDDHVVFHRVTREVFEERGVYDITFGYNLARLNLDRRHPDAGYRYAVEADDPTTLRAEFTPTTAFCPQGETLVRGSFRAWNGLAHRHEFDLVRVRVVPDHHDAAAINQALAEAETTLVETGELPTPESTETEPDASTAPTGNAPTSPF